MVQVTFQGNPVTLVGKPVQVGEEAPDFTVLNNALEEVSLADYAGKKKLISVVPSLDTGVCSDQTKRFNEEIDNLDNVAVLTVCMELTFVQGSLCETVVVIGLDVLSRYLDDLLGQDYGIIFLDVYLLA